MGNAPFMDQVFVKFKSDFPSSVHSTPKEPPGPDTPCPDRRIHEYYVYYIIEETRQLSDVFAKNSKKKIKLKKPPILWENER